MDNFNSYNRFTALPPNISQFGVTVEEVQLQKGKPDANPVAAPMADPRVAEARLSLGRSGSDLTRLQDPSRPAINPYEGARSLLHSSQNAVTKLTSPVVTDLKGAVLASNDPNMSLMQDSLTRVGNAPSR